MSLDDNLFTASRRDRPRPLADEVRPPRLDDVIGQAHLLRPGSTLRNKIASGRLGSVILFGSSGIGKTTIARAIGAEMGLAFRQLHGAMHKAEDIRAVEKEAEVRDILLFVDEIHRFSSAQQDLFLKMTELGTVSLVAATTGNPNFVLTTALVSRSSIFELKPLTVEEMEAVIRRSIHHLASRKVTVRIAPETLAMLAGRASGDARRAINSVEDLTANTQPGEAVTITTEMVEEYYAASPIPYDRSGDAHYDVISAFIKSMRGSDPDATLYWLARLIHSGEDPRYIARRIMIHASEDVGLADNTALATAVAANTAVQTIGYPEAQIVLAHAALHIARAPKSNSACRGIGLALEHVRSQPAIPVPAHLRDAHYPGAATLGRTGYAFPHDDGAGWVPQEYAPGIGQGLFYQSDARGGGTFEQRADDFWAGVTGQDQARRFR